MQKLIKTFSTYQASCATGVIASGDPVCHFWPSQLFASTGFQTQLALTSIEIFNLTAVASRLGLKPVNNLPTALTENPLVGVLVGQGNGGWTSNQGVGRIQTVWTNPPQSSSNVSNIKLAQLAAVVGDSVLWTWPEDNPLATANIIQPTTAGDLGPGYIIENIGAGASAEFFVMMTWSEYRLDVIP